MIVEVTDRHDVGCGIHSKHLIDSGAECLTRRHAERLGVGPGGPVVHENV
jgi:hypothetical protein